LALETGGGGGGGGGGSEDVVEQSYFVLIKMPTLKIQGIPSRHSREERDIKVDSIVIGLDSESSQFVDEIPGIIHMVRKLPRGVLRISSERWPLSESSLMTSTVWICRN
jgi:hypothetical protein